MNLTTKLEFVTNRHMIDKRSISKRKKTFFDDKLSN